MRIVPHAVSSPPSHLPQHTLKLSVSLLLLSTHLNTLQAVTLMASELDGTLLHNVVLDGGNDHLKVR